MSDSTPNSHLPESPFPGIVPFSYGDRSVFFAREAEIRALIRLIVMYRGVLLYADSGIGKSSLINAGLVPQAIEEGYQPERIRVQPRQGEEIIVERFVETVDGEPRLLPSIFAEEEQPERTVLSVEQFLTLLRAKAGPVRPLLVFDQFEEWVTLFEEEVAGQGVEEAKASQEKVREAIVSLINDSTLPVKVLIALREDYLAKLTPFFTRCPSLPDQYLRLTALQGEQIYRAIRGPFDTYPGRYQPEVGTDLAKDIQTQFTSRSGGADVRLTEVQIVCRSLWEAGRKASGEALDQIFTGQGGVQGILERYLEDTLTSLGHEQQEPAIGLLSRMVTSAGTRNVISEDDLVSRVELEDQIPRDVLIRTLDDLEQKAKLVRRERRREVYYYEIASEFLIGWIRTKAQERQGQAEQRKREKAEREAEEQAKAAKRLRRLSMALVVMLLLAVGAAVFAWFQKQQATVAQIMAEQQTRIATSRQLAAQSLNHLDDQPDLAFLLSWEANRFTDTVEGRGGLLKALQHNPRLTTFLHGHTNSVRSVAFSPDGKTLASGSGDNTIILWDVASRQPLGQPLTGHTNRVWSVAFSPDGKTLASGSGDNTIILWDVASRQPLGQPLTGHTNSVQSVAFSPDGKTLASGSGNTSISWGSVDLGTIILWDVASRQPLGQPLTGHTGSVSSVAFSPDGKTLASGSWDHTIILRDVASQKLLGQPLTGHTDVVWSVAFSPDGKTLASGSEDKTIILWDVASRQPLGQPLTDHTGSVHSVAFSPDGQTLASGSVDNTIILWEVASRKPLGQPLTGHTSYVYSVAFSPDGKTLASGSEDKTIILWEVASRQPLGQPLTGHTGSVHSVAFSPDGKTLASGSWDKTIILWDVASHQPLGQPLTGHTNRVWSVAFSPDGKTLASGSDDKTIILWDVASRQPLGQPLTGHTNVVWSVAFSPDGKTLASGSDDKTIILWDVASRQPLGQPLTGHTNRVQSVVFSPDGKTLASGSEDKTLILWDVASRQPLGQPLTGHTRFVVSVAFSPDGKTLASGIGDNTIILWDVASRQPLGQPLTGHTDVVWSVAFSPDGKTLASGIGDNTIILWDVSFESWKDRACRIANRNLTRAEWKQYLGDEPYCATCPDLPLEEEKPAEGKAEKQAAS